MTRHPPVFALLTDFGLSDEYVGVIKAVLLGRQPAAQIIDLCHAVPPHDVVYGAFILQHTLAYLPGQCITLAIVDPGVGTTRQILIVQTDGRLFIGPDNGLLTPAIRSGAARIIRMSADAPYLPAVSATFHGRDIFAPLAADLANGFGLTQFGQEIAADSCQLLPPSRLERDPTGITGEIIHIDHFGNCCSSITCTHLPADVSSSLHLSIAGRSITGISQTYGKQPSGQLIALWDSRGHLEVAAVNSSAAQLLDIQRGAPLRLSWSEKVKK